MVGNSNILGKCVTIGPEFIPPKGGIAQVISNYKEYVFKNDFHFIANSCTGSKIKKAMCAMLAVLKLVGLLLFNWQIKLVHIHTASYTSFVRSCLYLSISKAMGRKVIMHVHGGAFKDYFNDSKPYVIKNLRRCDCVVVLSDYWKRFMQEEVGLTNVEIVNNIIPKPELASQPVGDGKIHALFMGLLIHDKGIYDLIDALVDLKNQLTGHFMLHVCGTGETEAVKQRIREAGITELITLEGWVSGESKTQLMNKCDLFILPSYIEGLPLSILEAMSYKMYVIATNVGSIPEVLGNTTFGEVINPGDKEALAESIKQYSKLSKSELQSKTEDAFDASRDYWPSSIQKQLVDIYEKLLVE